jgi:hypothetical protein
VGAGRDRAQLSALIVLIGAAVAEEVQLNLERFRLSGQSSSVKRSLGGLASRGGLLAWIFAAACGSGESDAPAAGSDRARETPGHAGSVAEVSGVGGSASEGHNQRPSAPGEAGKAEVSNDAGATGDAGDSAVNASGGSAGSGSVGGSGSAGGSGARGGATGSAGEGGADAGSSGETHAGGASDGGAGSADVDSYRDGFHVTVIRASDVKPSAPGTVGIVTFSAEVSALVTAHIEFGLDTSYGMTAPVDLDAPEHRTLLLGMKPSRLYHLSIVVSDGNFTYRSADRTLVTGPATTLVPYAGFTVVDEARRERGFLQLSYWYQKGSNVPFIVDADGEIVWWYESSMLGVSHAVLSATGKNLWLVGPGIVGTPLRRISMDTLEEQIYPGTFGSHDLTAVTGETMAFIDYGETDCDSVFEIEPSGVTREVFESEGVLDPKVCHGNAIRYSAKQDTYTYSDRYEDILGLSRAGEVLWRLSERVPGGRAAWGGSQHGHQLLDSSLLVFANRGMNETASAAIEYDFLGNEIARFQSGHYTLHMGDAQRLPGGNTLVNFSNESVIQEFAPDGSVVLEIDAGGSNLGYSTWLPSLYGPPPVSTP